MLRLPCDGLLSHALEIGACGSSRVKLELATGLNDRKWPAAVAIKVRRCHSSLHASSPPQPLEETSRGAEHHVPGIAAAAALAPPLPPAAPSGRSGEPELCVFVKRSIPCLLYGHAATSCLGMMLTR